MINRRRAFFLCLLPVFSLNAIAQNFGGNPSSIKWKQVNTPSAKVIFPAGLDSQANRIGNIIELLNSNTINGLGNHHRKWNIILQNQTTVSNGYVRLAPVMSEFYMTPTQDNFAEGSLRWDDNLAIHESRHMQQFSNFNNGLTKVFSFVLGQQGQLLANGITVPDYFFEGDAVWQETFVSEQGRGRLPEFFNGFKSLWLDKKNYSWMKLRSGSYKDFTPDHYPLGYMLTAYGNEKYGKDFWRNVTSDAVRFKGLFYAFNKAIERYSGKPYKSFRKEALDFFKAGALPPNENRQDTFHYLTSIEKNNVIDYTFPVFSGNDSILIARHSYKSVNAFYMLVKGVSKKIRIRNTVIDDYFSYSNGIIVYAAYQSDPRWANRDYSVLQLVNIKTGRQKQLTYKSKYFSPDINKDASEIIAVQVNPNGINNLLRLNAVNGNVILTVPNPANYFFTQTKYIDRKWAVSAVRNPAGKMALVKVDLENGATENITPFSFNVVGYPFIAGDTVYFNASNGYADQVFAVSMSEKIINRLLNNINGVYNPVINAKGEMIFSVFTSSGLRLAIKSLSAVKWEPISNDEFIKVHDSYAPGALKKEGAGAVYKTKEKIQPATSYTKSFHLFNFHSRRPVVADPEYGYSFYSDNILSSLSSELTYTYNRNEGSHTVGFNGIFAGWFPVLSLVTEAGFNRTLDTAVARSVNFNSAKIAAGVNIPLNFSGGRTSKYFNIGGSYNAEQLYYRNIGKNIFNNEAFQYLYSFFSFSNSNRQARQHVNPRWAQAVSANYRYAFNLRKSRKFVGSTNFYFPGLFVNHSLVLQGAFQKRDSLPDIFNNNFSYSRGYLALSTRRMYKLAVNYQLPLLYPDIGFANIIFFQRIRANSFFDYTSAYVRLNGTLTDIINRSVGTEIFFDTKVWNALPVTFGIRYSRLLDTDLRNPGAGNRWEFLLPIALIPR